MASFSDLLRRWRITGGLARPRFCVLCLSLLIGSGAGAADWPQWRGPNRDGISAENGWKSAWPAEGPKVLWKQSVGAGCSSLAVAGDRVFTMGNEKDTDSVYCLDAKTGKILWQHSYPSLLATGKGSLEGGPCSTPAVDDNAVFTLGRQGQLFCLNKETGAVIWSKDLPKDFGLKPVDWGYTGSPLVIDKLLIIDVGAKGASAVAFDKATGKVIWQAGDDAASYGSPVAFEHGGKRCLAHFNVAGLVIREASSGTELFRYPWKTQYNTNAATPIICGDKIFIASGYGHGAALLKLGADGLTPLWETKNMKNKISTSVLWEGNLYGFDESKLTCLDFATGSVKWQQDGLGLGSLTIAGGKLLVLGATGKLVIVEPSPGAFKEIAAADVLDKRTFVAPVLANGRIYCRANSGNLACLDVSGQ